MLFHQYNIGYPDILLEGYCTGYQKDVKDINILSEFQINMNLL